MPTAGICGYGASADSISTSGRDSHSTSAIDSTGHHYPKQQAGRRFIRPAGAYGLNLRSRSCLVAIDEEHIVHVTGSLLVLQSLEELGKFTVLPEHDRIRSILGIHVCETLQILAVCALDWDGKCLLVLYHTAGLKVGPDDMSRSFRKARTFDLPISDAAKVEHDGVTMSFSPAGKTLVAVVDGVLHVIDWQRNKVLVSFRYPGGKVTAVRFDPIDHSRISLSGRGFFKLWRIKHNTVSPLSDVQGLQLNNQDVVDHLWLYDGTAVLMATKQGRFACLDLNKSKQRFMENLLGDGACPCAMTALGRQAFVVLGQRGRIALLRENENHARRKDGQDRVVLVRVLNTAGLPHELLGCHYLSGNQARLAFYSRNYLGKILSDKLFKKGLEEGPPAVDVTLCRDFHCAPIICISACARKPLIATCTCDDRDVSVRVWNYALHRCMVTLSLDKAHRPSSVAFHPSGNQLVVSLEDRVQVYQVMEKDLRLAYEIPLRGALRVPNAAKNFYFMTKVHHVSFNHGGSLLCVVTGKVLQLLSYYSTTDGLPAREYVLAGHTSDVIATVWAPDDLRLFSASKDAIMEWRVGSSTRVREAFLQGPGRFLGLTLTFDGTLMAPCLLPSEDEEDGGEQVVLRVWGGSGGGQTNIEGPSRSHPLPEMVTCVTATCNATSEANELLVENVLLAGTEKVGCMMLELSKLPNTADNSPPHMLRRSMHAERTTAVARSVCGEWLFVGAADGSLYTCELRVHKDKSRHDTKDHALETNELLLIDEAVTSAERSLLLSVEAQIQQLQADLVEQQSINNYQIEAATQEREKLVSSMKEEYDDALFTRDRRIRELETTVERLQADMSKEVRDREAAYAQGAAELELQHQRKLTASAMQYKKLKDAFNDLVVAARDDSAEAKAESKLKQQELTEAFDKERAALVKDQEILRGYADYLKKQYSTLLDREDKSHDDEVITFKAQLEVERQKVCEAGLSQKSELHLLHKEIAMLQLALTDKDDMYIDLKVKMEQEVRKTAMLERKIKEQEKDIANHIKAIEKWEGKAGEQEQHLNELSKTRNVLLSQLREMRDMLPRKEKELVEMKGRLQEIDVEYGKGLQSRAELDKKITEQGRLIKSLQQELILVTRAYAKKENLLEHVREEIRDLVEGRVVDKTDLANLRERMREYLPCLEKDAGDSEAKDGLTPLTPADLAIADQAKQKVFLQRDLSRLARKLDTSQGAQNKLVKIRTIQNNMLMAEMNKLRRYNRKLEMKLRDMTARYENELHRVNRAQHRTSQTQQQHEKPDDLLLPGELGQALISTFSPDEAAALLGPSSKGRRQRPATSSVASSLPSTAAGEPEVHSPGASLAGHMSPPRSMTAALMPAGQRAMTAGGRKLAPRGGRRASRTPGTAGTGTTRVTPLSAAHREIDMQREAERANSAEAALDVALTENAKLGALVTGLTHFLRSIGHDVNDML